MKNNCIYKFLASLNIKFEEVRGRIIGKKHLPLISEAFSEVKREESRKNVMIGNKNSSRSIENLALVASDANASTAITNQRKTDDKPRVWCDYCNKPCHTQEACWKIHSKPTNWKSNKMGDKSNRGFPSADEVETSPFSKEQMDHFLKLLNSNSLYGIPSDSVAQAGSDSNALSYCLKTAP